MVSQDGQQCENCADFYWPDANFTACQKITPTQTLSDSVVERMLTMIFFTLNIAIAVYFIRHRENRFIKATSIELSLLMMFGISLGYINILLAAVPSSTLLCAVMGILVYLAIAFRLCALFTRTLLIYRVFKNSEKSAARLRYTSKLFQVIMCLSLVAIQLGLSLICLPKLVPKQPDVHRRYVEES
jgi:hypothetical protein